MIYARQGDVIIGQPVALPIGVRKLSLSERGQVSSTNKCYILAYGEVTGHSHKLMVQEEGSVELYEKDGVLYASVKSPTEIVHEEHTAVPVVPSKKVYPIWTQREYRLGDTQRVLD